MSVALVGELALWVALLLAAWGTTLSSIAGPLARPDFAQSGARAAHAATLFVALALLALWIALLRTELGLEYVAMRGGLAATPVERVIALWSAPAGALLVLALATGSLTSVALALAPRRWITGARRTDRVLLAPGAATAQLLMLGILLTAVASAPPFARTTWALADGQGLPPAWRHVAMIALWPLWSVAVAAAAAASSLCIAAALGSVPRALVLWRAALDSVRTAWLFATAAILLGLWWSYRTTPSIDGWISRAVGPGALVAWAALVLASSRSVAERLRSNRARFLVLAAPLILLMAASLAAPEMGWDPLHELAHGAGGAWWVVSVAAIVLLLAFVAVRLGGTAPVPTLGGAAAGQEALPAFGRRLAMVGGALAAVGLFAAAFPREASLELVPGRPATITDLIGREWRVVYQGMSVRDSRTAQGAPRAHEALYPIALGRGKTETIIVPHVREMVDVLGRPTAPPWPYPGIRHGLLQDVTALPDSVGDADTAHVRIAFVPLPSLIWLGGVTLLLGAALVAHAERGRRA